MVIFMLKKEVVSLCMESPLYFTMPLRKRMELVKQYERRLSTNNLREAMLNWVKNGSSQAPGNPEVAKDKK